MNADRPGIEAISRQPAAGAAFPSGVERLTFRSGADGAEDWALLWPPESGSHWCVVIHGHGSHGDQLYVRQDIRRDWLPRFRERGMGILTPNVRDNGWMSPAVAGDLHALLGFVRRECGAQRFTFAGGSMGGSCNLTYAVLYPKDVSELAALCPVSDLASFHAWLAGRTNSPAQAAAAKALGPQAEKAETNLVKVLGEVMGAIREQYDGPPAEQADIYRRHSAQANAARLTMPVYVAHGDADALVPVEQSRTLAALCRGPRFRYREIPGGDHEAPIAAAILDEALAWILGPASTGS